MRSRFSRVVKFAAVAGAFKDCPHPTKVTPLLPATRRLRSGASGAPL